MPHSEDDILSFRKYEVLVELHRITIILRMHVDKADSVESDTT